MNIQVHRDIFTEQSTGGILSVDGSVEGYTLEPARKDPPAKPRCIPPGTYAVKMAWSPKHGRMMPLLIDVPDFTAVEIHPGNWPHDTEACLLTGAERGENCVMSSKLVFEPLRERIIAAALNHEPITITYTESQAAARAKPGETEQDGGL